MKKIVKFLNDITMYRSVVYFLLLPLAGAFCLSFFKLFNFSPTDLFVSAVFITAVCFFSNALLAWAFNAPSNIDSVYITALILILIITPPKAFTNLMFLGWISVIAMASKYIIAIGKKHFLNPAAISVAIVGFAARQYASWWIANIYLLPFVVVGSYFVIKKVRRLDLFASFFISTMFTSTIFCLASGQEVIPVLYKIIVYSPSLFFASIMLTEPMSLPPIKKLRIIYGAIVGILFVPQVHIGPFYFSPELALILGNIFVYLVSPDQKLILKLGNMIKITPDIYDFTFIPRNEMIFKPGQYMEITFDHPGQDSRGIRRYLTIASSPTEKEFRLGIKFYPRPSSFKKNLLKMDKNQYIVASQLAGDFTMPSDISKKLVFIAGGIGITPFRSMIKYMLDVNEKRDVHLLYLNKRIEDIAYKDIFDQAEKELELKTEYSIIGIPDNLYYKSLTEKIPDYKERVFYISGPSEMVSAFESNLVKSGVKKYNIRTDYFPGFA